MRIGKLKQVHCIGIGGIHVSALGKLLLARGVEVSGSDLVKSEITDELEGSGADINIGHKDSNVELCDLVIYSDAVPEDNVERKKAKELGIEQMSSYDFIGELSKDYYTIAVSGTNGKSTTTAMLGLILEAAGLDPTVIVGTKVDQWGGNIRIGKSKYLVTEADEYKAHMLKLNPKMIVLTNLEEDHLDFYKDLDDIVEHFRKYVGKLSEDGVLVYNKDDANVAKLLHCYIARKVGYTVGDVSSLRLRVPGEFNRYNAAAAAVAAKGLGVSNEVIKQSLEEFKGTWRRFERVGQCKGATVISDYAHHPTSVAGTIRATKELYPDRRLIAVFQPHQHNRTRKLFKDFVSAFAKASADKLVDLIILSEVYDVAGRTTDEDKKVGSRDLVEEIKKLSHSTTAGATAKAGQAGQASSGQGNKEIKDDEDTLYAKDLNETKGIILENIKEGDVVLIMGAGSIDEVARDLTRESYTN